MRNIITKGIAISLLLASSIAQAIPTLFFDGNISYDGQNQRLTVDSILTDTFDITPQPDLTGSLYFEADLINQFVGFGLAIGTFGTTAGQDDILVLDANNSTLLSGNFTSLIMSGNIGSTNSTMTGEFLATGGSLSSLFGLGNVFALQFNLDTALNSNTFNENFSAHIDGRLEGTPVPEPSLLALLGLGIFMTGFARRYNTKH